MKRLYDSSLGRLELDLEAVDLSIWLFDAEGRVVAESGDEWDWADLSALLHLEIGLPEPEAQSIVANFMESSERQGVARAGRGVTSWQGRRGCSSRRRPRSSGPSACGQQRTGSSDSARRFVVFTSPRSALLIRPTQVGGSSLAWAGVQRSPARKILPRLAPFLA